MRWRDWYGRGRYVPESLPIALRRKKSAQGPPVVRRTTHHVVVRRCLFHSLRTGASPFGIEVLRGSSNQRTKQVPVLFCDQCARAFQQNAVRRHKGTNIWWFAESRTKGGTSVGEGIPAQSRSASRCFFHSDTSAGASIRIRLIAYGDESLCTNWFSVNTCGPCWEAFAAKATLKMKQTHIWWQIRPKAAPTSNKAPASAGRTPSVGAGNPTPAYKKFGQTTPEPGYRGKGIRRDGPSW